MAAPAAAPPVKPDDFRKYVILGACDPNLAHQALQQELELGLLLLCNVIVYEEGAGSVVSIVDPLSMLGVVENPALQPIVDKATGKLQRVECHTPPADQNAGPESVSVDT